MNIRHHTTWLATLAVLTAAGCGFEPGGGAAVVPAVTVLPADLSGADVAAEVTDSGDATQTEAPASSAAGPGTFAGRVVMTGAAPQLPPLISAGADVKDKEVCADGPVPDERLVLSPDGKGVANVFVYLQKAPKGAPELETSGEMVFDQKNCRFIPHCMVIPTGQTVKVLSDDPIAHNTHSYPAKNQGVNSGVSPHDREGKLEIVYRRAEQEPLPVKCDYHTWMTAYHLPVDHPYAALTDADGNFEIPNLPAGEYDFSVWHEAAQGNFVERRLSVTVKAGEVTQQEIAYSADKLAL